MIQKPNTLPMWIGVVAATLALAVGPLPAQDDQPDPAAAAPAEEPKEPAEPKAPTPPPEDRIRFSVDIGVWVAQPAGLALEPVSVIDPLDPFGTTVDDLDFGSETDARYAFGVDFGHGNGGIKGTWWGSSPETDVTEARPADFVFGELLAYPELAGYANDGLADGYDASASTLIRELRIDYYHPAFESSRVSGRWFVGYRQVACDRMLDAAYFAFEPLMPPLFPPFLPEPRTDLTPLPDTALTSSSFNGRGLEGGLYVTVPLTTDKTISVEGGFAMAALRGDIDTVYQSTNSYYLYTDNLGNQTILDPPYDQFDDVIPGTPPVYVVDSITQETTSIGLKTDRRSASASVLEIELAMRWRFWKTLGVFGGFRSSRYDNVAVELIPAAPTGTNRQGMTEIPHSVTFEGFFFGLTLGF